MRRIARAAVVATLLGSICWGVGPADPVSGQDAPAVPTAVDDHFSQPLSQSFSVGEPGVLANDVGVPGGGPLSAQLVSAPDWLFERFTPGGAFVILFIEPPELGDYELTYVVRQVVDGEVRTSAPATVVISLVERWPTALAVDPVVLKVAGLGIKLGRASARLTVPPGVSDDLPFGLHIPEQPVTFSAGAAPLCTATTDNTGVATCALDLGQVLTAILAGGITASYAGIPTLAPSTGSNGLIS